MRGILIDPFEMTCTEVQYEGDYNEVYKLIKADLFDIIGLEFDDSLFVDDEGLHKQNEFFEFEGYPQQIAGRAVVLGTSLDGDTVSAVHTLEQIKKRVKFVTPARVNGEIIWMPSAIARQIFPAVA